MRRSRRGGCARILTGIILIGAGIALVRQVPQWLPPSPVSVNPGSLPVIGQVSDRFLSYNVEMVELTGGRFWRPYRDGVRKGDDRYEYRPPIDLTTPRLVKLAAALGPAYVRFSGTWANATFFDAAATGTPKAPPGFDTVLTGDQWRRAVAFARQADAEIVTSFATSKGTRDARGFWHPQEAAKLIDFTRSIGARIAAAEFANEPETVELTQAPAGYTPANYRRDYTTFHRWMRQASPSTLLLGPGAAILGEPTEFLRKWASGYTIFEPEDLVPPGSDRPDAVSFHFYGGGSERCGKVPVIGYGRADAMSDRWLGQIDAPIDRITALRAKIAPAAPVWLTETGETACGGNPWAATFLDTFRFVDQIGRTARRGVKVYLHNTLTASDYGLLDERTHAPRPDYWAAWLWRRFMGTIVLDAGPATRGLRLYAHCLKDAPGGVAIAAINLDKQRPRMLRLPQPARIYTLTEGGRPDAAALNGRVLALGPGDSLPTLNAAAVTAGELRLAPASITFVAIPKAAHAACF